MIYLLFCSVVWAFSYGLIKENLAGVHPDFVAFVRMLVPMLCFAPFLRAKALPWREKGILMGIGAVQYGLMYLLVIRAYSYLSSYQVVFFTACTPLYVTLIANLYEGKLRLFDLLLAGAAFGGTAFLLYPSVSLREGIWGCLLVQLSDLCFAWGQVAYKQWRLRNGAFQERRVYGLLFCGGSLVTAFSTTLFQGWSQMAALSSQQVYLLLYLGAVASGVCFFLWNWGAVRLASGTVAILNNVKIPLGVLVSIFIFKERADLPAVCASLALIAAALFLSQRDVRKRKYFLEKTRES